MSSVLIQLTGKDVNLDAASDRECRQWASLLGENIKRMRMIRSKDHEFAVLEGLNLQELFSDGQYSSWKGLIDPSDRNKAPEPLNEYWRDSIHDFANFLELCTGLVPYSLDRARAKTDD